MCRTTWWAVEVVPQIGCIIIVGGGNFETGTLTVCDTTETLQSNTRLQVILSETAYQEQHNSARFGPTSEYLHCTGKPCQASFTCLRIERAGRFSSSRMNCELFAKSTVSPSVVVSTSGIVTAESEPSGLRTSSCRQA